jgi:hypothetical protein
MRIPVSLEMALNAFLQMAGPEDICPFQGEHFSGRSHLRIHKKICAFKQEGIKKNKNSTEKGTVKY